MSGRLSKLLSARVARDMSGERILRGAPILFDCGVTTPHINAQTEVQSWPLASAQCPGQSASRGVLLAAPGLAHPTSAITEAAIKEDSANMAMRVSVSRRSISGIRSVADRRLHRE